MEIPRETYAEVLRGKTDLLTRWFSADKKVAMLNELPDERLVAHVKHMGYARDLDDQGVQGLGHVPFLIASAFDDRANCHVGITEVSRR